MSLVAMTMWSNCTEGVASRTTRTTANSLFESKYSELTALMTSSGTNEIRISLHVNIENRRGSQRA